MYPLGAFRLHARSPRRAATSCDELIFWEQVADYALDWALEHAALPSMR